MIGCVNHREPQLMIRKCLKLNIKDIVLYIVYNFIPTPHQVTHNQVEFKYSDYM